MGAVCSVCLRGFSTTALTASMNGGLNYLEHTACSLVFLSNLICHTYTLTFDLSNKSVTLMRNWTKRRKLNSLVGTNSAPISISFRPFINDK